MPENNERKCVLRVYYNFKEGGYEWDFGEHNIGCFQLIGILHAVQTDLSEYNASISEKE